MVCCKPFFENQLEDFAGPKKKDLKKNNSTFQPKNTRILDILYSIPLDNT